MDKEKSGKVYGKIPVVFLTDLLITLWLSYFVFNSVFGLIAFFPVHIIHRRFHEKKEKEKADDGFFQRYREFLSGLSTGLRAGHSLENSMKDAREALIMLYGKNDDMVLEITKLLRQVSMNVPVEEAFGEFSRRHPFEEVLDMAEVLKIGKRFGGDYTENIGRAAEKIRQALLLKSEIKAKSAEKRLELTMMLILPPGILTYMRLCSPEFVEALYQTAIGFAAVLSAIGIYLFAAWWGSRIIRIEV